MTDHARNIKNLTKAVVAINESKQGMAMLDEKLSILRLLEAEIKAMGNKR